MKLIRHLDELPSTLRGGAVSIGNFDGVHRGHASIIAALREQAAKVSGPAIVFTFDPHPVRLLRPEHAPPPLTWTDRKAELLNELGVDALVVYPTDERMLNLAPAEFFREVVIQKLDTRAMVEGPNFYFGKGRAGNRETLRSLCEAHGITLQIVEPLVVDSAYISSSRVRDLIRAGDINHARRLLTQPYRIRGMVTHGAARGAKLGFPTANLDAVDTLLPGQGVYAGSAITNDQMWAAAINIGPNPTFGEQALKVEVHLIDYAGSLYGQPLEVDFLARLRDTRPFASVEELKQQLSLDVQAARQEWNKT